MTNVKKPRRMARPAAASPAEQAGQQSATPAEPVSTIVKRPSKLDVILDLMRADGGASLPAIIAATGWLPHTARAALTGLRKKGFAIEKSKVEAETRYSIKAGSAQ